MIEKFRGKMLGEKGLTLVEIVVVMAISAIIFTGMMLTYSEVARYTRENSSLMTLYNEGSAAMILIRKAIREAGRARIRPSGGVSNARLELDYNDIWGGGEAEFWFSKTDKKLKWSDRRRGTNRLHMTLLPMLNLNIGPQEEPYLKVKDLRFTPLDHIGTPSPYLEGYSLIKIEMVLEDDWGDTLYLSSVSSKRNDL
jgi:prepilin-type N-terminal cleavage/methylation domain-containing protein